MIRLPRHSWLIGGFGAALFASVVAGGLILYRAVFAFAVPEAEALRPFVEVRPPVPVVFTSRTDPASFDAVAPEAEGFNYPGTLPWAVREGRLRLLDTDGKVYELTWGRVLPDGGSLIDVMSPSVSIDGTYILFAGRKAAPDPGRWRVYRVNVDGSDLAQVTGLPGDPGCVAAPPLRYAADGSRLADADRKQLDFDDVDPCDDGVGGVFFASSRLPDLGRDHSRRATQIWHWPAGAAAPRPLSANRNNDRWPVLTSGDAVLFSSWSRNREAVTADRAEVRPVSAGGEYATRPTDQWFAARVFPNATQFGYAVKIPQPVWRPRPLFNGRVVFATTTPGRAGFRLAQADWGYLRAAPSSLAAGGELPAQAGGDFLYGPDRDAGGVSLSAGCPSPCPPGHILFAGCPVGAAPSSCGLCLVPDSFTHESPQLLFDDPALVDAEPAAVYARGVDASPEEPPTVAPGSRPDRIRLFPDRPYGGPLGLIANNVINQAMPDPFPGQRTDAGRSPVVPHPTGIKAVAVYAAHRDRFDDPEKPRLAGGWEKLLVAPLDEHGALNAWVPADPLTPTVLAGFGSDGKVFRWAGTAPDSAGRVGTYYAIAGDHYSGTRANGYHFCIGCHTGHTFITADVTERAR